MNPAFATTIEAQLKKTPPTLMKPEEQAAADKSREAKDPSPDMQKALDELAARYAELDKAFKLLQAEREALLKQRDAAMKRADELAVKYAQVEALYRAAQADAADKEVKDRLSMARSFIEAGMPAKAKPYLEQVIQKHPDTAHAKEAKELLEQMRK